MKYFGKDGWPGKCHPGSSSSSLLKPPKFGGLQPLSGDADRAAPLLAFADRYKGETGLRGLACGQLSRGPELQP